jgi:transcriptional regulator with XRE-family HTH domain
MTPELAARIRGLRGHKPQPVMAQECGVTLRAYQRWEAGGGISWENLQRIAEVGKTTTSYLIDGEAEPRGPQTQLDRIEAKLDQLLEVAQANSRLAAGREAASHA